MPAVAAVAPRRTTRTVPRALITAPVVGSARTEPTAIASRTRPSWPLVRSKLERTSGMRETQLAKTSPLRKNVSPTALRAAGQLRHARQRLFQSVPGGPDSSQDWNPVSDASLIAISRGSPP